MYGRRFDSAHLHSTRALQKSPLKGLFCSAARSWQATRTLRPLFSFRKGVSRVPRPKWRGTDRIWYIRSMYFVYMSEDKTKRLYTGVSDSPSRRIREHNGARGAGFTSNGDFSIVFLEPHGTLEAARQREIQIKKWWREKKDMLIRKYQAGESTYLP